MADDQHLQAIEGTGPAVPVFGRRSGTFDERKFRSFGIEVESDDERFVETFDAYLDADAGAILGLMNARNQMQQANATAILLGTSLRDDDGVSSDWRFPTEPEYDEDGRIIWYRPDPDDPDGDLLEWVVPEVEEGEEVPPPPEGSGPRYEWHDGELLTEGELREAIEEFDPLEVGSSRRRFQYLADSPRYRIKLDALNDLAEWLIGEEAKRPTRRPSSSGRGPQQTRRTSGGRRSGSRA